MSKNILVLLIYAEGAPCQSIAKLIHIYFVQKALNVTLKNASSGNVINVVLQGANRFLHIGHGDGRKNIDVSHFLGGSVRIDEGNSASLINGQIR